MLRQDLLDRALRQIAVADLAPAGTAQRLDLTGAKGREVVVQHETLALISVAQRVQTLFVLPGAQGHGHHGLRLAPGENRRAVNRGKHANFTADAADLVESTPVDADPLGESATTGVSNARFVEGLRNFLVALGVLLPLATEVVESLVLHRLEGRRTLVLGAHVGRLDHLLPNEVANLVVQRGIDFRLNVLALGLTNRLAQSLLQVDQRLHLLVGEHERVDHQRLTHLFHATLDHRDRVARRGDDHVHGALFLLFVGRVGDQLVVDAAHANPGDRAIPHQVGSMHRGRGTGDGVNLGGVDLVEAHNVGDQLSVNSPRLGKQRPDGAIHQATREDFPFGGAPLSFKESPGDVAGGVGALFVLAGERHEVHAFPRPGGAACGDQEHGVANAKNDRPRRLLGPLASFQRDLFATDGDAFAHKTHGVLQSVRSACPA